MKPDDRCKCCGAIIRDKSVQQRNKFHKICDLVGKEIGLSPGQVKSAIKQDHFGIDEFKMGDKWYRTVKSSEDEGKSGYSDLIEAAYRWAAENGVVIDA